MRKRLALVRDAEYKDNRFDISLSLDDCDEWNIVIRFKNPEKIIEVADGFFYKQKEVTAEEWVRFKIK